MKKIMVACLIIFLSAASCFARTLEVVTLQYPPYAYKEKSDVKGVATEVVRAVFRKMGQPIEIKLYPWARAIKMIELGEADAIFTAYKNPTREKFSDYSREILIQQAISLFVLKSSPAEFDGDLGKLLKYRFGGVRKVSYGTVFDQAVENGVISSPELTITGEVNMSKLLKGRFDILVSNRYGALYILKKMNKLDKVRELSPIVQSVPSYITFSKKRDLTLVRDKFDVVLADMKRNGTYGKIISNFFNKQTGIP